MSKFLNNINLEAGNDIQFKTTAGVNAGKIEQDGNNLVLTSAVGDVLLGDGSSDVYIGDGTNNVDILFEQSGSIKGDGSAVTLTIGGANTTLNLENPNINGTLSLGVTSINNKLTFTTANGYILFDHEPSGDTGAYEGATSVPLLKIDRGGTEKTILERVSEQGGLLLGADDSVIIAAGDTRGVLRTNLNEAAETVIFASEGGFHAYGFPSNDTTWSNRNEFRFRGDSATASENGLYIGDGSSTQFIDLSRNLKNIGTIAVGLASPTSPLTIKSNSVSSSDSALTIQGNSNTNAIVKIAERATDGARFHMYDGGVEKIAFYTDGTDNHISAGNVGIGTTSPGAKLEVSSTGNIAAIINSTNTFTFLDLENDGTNRVQIGNASDGDFIIRTADTERMRIDDAGNVGIGTTSSDTKLHIALGGGSAQLTLERTGGGAGKAVLAGASEGFIVYDDAFGAKMYVGTSGTYNGNVGIGTTSPAHRFSVTGDSTSQQAVAKITRQQASASNNTYTFEVDSSAHASNMTSGGAMAVDVNSGRAFTINGFGNVGIGTGSPQQLLHVNGEAQFGPTSYQGDMNGGKADLSVDCGGTSQISWVGDYFQVGGTDLNYNMRATAGLIDTWSQDLTIRAGNTGTTAKLRLGTNGQTSTIVCNNGDVGIGTDTPSDQDLSINTPKLHVVGPSTTGAFNLVARFQGGNDNDNTGAAILINHSNDRGLLINAGRADSDREVAYFNLVSSGAVVTNVLTLRKVGSYHNAGIGVTDPDAKLEIKGSSSGTSAYSLRVRNSSNTEFFSVRDDGVTTVNNNYFYVLASQGAYVQNALRVRGSLSNDVGVLSITGDVNFDSNTMFVDSADNRVGIGTNNPSHLLHVYAADGVAVDSYISLVQNAEATAGDNFGLKVQAGRNSSDVTMEVSNAVGTSYMRVRGDGNVGIGTNNPTTKFHIDDNATSGTGLLVTGGGVGNALATFTRDVGGSGSVEISSNNSRPQIKFAALSNTFALGVNGSTFEIADNATLGTNARLSITNTGNVGIGITNPNDILQVKSSMSIIDSNGTNVHCQLSSNASEGVLRIHNGTNYGLIARGSANNPYLGAYYGGSLNIVGFGSSDGATIDDQLAVFDFGNSQFKLYDSKQLVIGDGADLRLFHNGSHSYIHNDTGDIYIENDTTDGDIFFKSDNGSGGLATYLKLDGGTTTLQAYKDLLIANDTAKIKLGASQDLQIYHDGSHSYIQDSGTGVLKLLGSGVTIQNAVGSENMLVATENGSVDLYYDSNKKLETTSTGVDITGITTSNAFRTDTSNTDYNVISRNSTSTTLWVQAAQSNSLQGIASFRYGSATVNQGTEVFRIRRDGVNVFGTNFTVGGTITGNSKNFSIPHPTKEGKRLVHSCLEGPEIGVYFRGRSTSTTIEMPDYWSGLVHLDSMTVELTAIGPNQDLYVANIADDGDVTVASNTDTALNYFYVIYGERKDLERLEVEIDDTVEVEEPEEVSFPD